MIRLSPYRELNKLIQKETYEPVFSWGLRMAIAAIVPIIWGVATDQMHLASWITIAAECICWVELKGSFAQRVRALLAGTFLTLFFAFAGAVSSKHIGLSVAVMILVGFLSGLFKNLGERGAGLAVCIQVMFILSLAHPVSGSSELMQRLSLVLTGGLWTMLVGVVASAVLPRQQPFRRSVAVIWKANAELAAEIGRGWDGQSARSSIRELYEKEKQVRTSLDSSFHFFETMAHQVKKDQKEKYQLAQLRKATALVASTMIAMSEELESIRIREVSPELRIKLYDTLRALQQALERMGVFVVNLKAEEALLIHSRILRLNRLIALLKEHSGSDPEIGTEKAKRVIQLMERTVKLMETSLKGLEEMGEDAPVFRSYSLIQTLLILHPRHWLRNMQLLFNFSTNNARYALRSALAAAAGIFLYQWFQIDYGYWIAFTALIVVQPYFSATLRRAIDRVAGTLAGGIAGGLLVRLPADVYAKEIMLFISFVFMVYFIRKRYAVAVFFITMTVVLLFDVEDSFNADIIVSRSLCTIAGAVLGISAGFALLPTWDRNQLPVYLVDAVACNYQYFLATFFRGKEVAWTKHKRSAETKNSNAFDSFTRFMQEPGKRSRRAQMAYYQLINHSVRITRELNNIHLEQEAKGASESSISIESQQQLLLECLDWFNRDLRALGRLKPGIEELIEVPPLEEISGDGITLQQKIYLDKLLIELKSLHQDLGHIS